MLNACPGSERFCVRDDEGNLICLGAVSKGHIVRGQLYLIRPRNEFETAEEMCKRRGRRIDRMYVAAHFTLRYCARRTESSNIHLDVMLWYKFTTSNIVADVRYFQSRRAARRSVYRRSARALLNLIGWLFEKLEKFVASCYSEELLDYGIYEGVHFTIRRRPHNHIVGMKCYCKDGRISNCRRFTIQYRLCRRLD